MPRIIDVTLPVRPGMLTYPGDPVVSIERTSDMRNGDISNLSIVSMSTHTGTHVDPPIHFVEDGATVDAMPLETLVGEAVVVDVRGVGTIVAGELEALELPADVERLLFPPTGRNGLHLDRGRGRPHVPGSPRATRREHRDRGGVGSAGRAGGPVHALVPPAQDP